MEIIKRRHAKAAGLTRYFTGKPCVNGHVCERAVATRSCRECRNIWTATWRARYPEKNKQIDRACKHRNRDKINAKQRAWSNANREFKREYTKAWMRKNVEKSRLWSSNYKIENPEKARAISKKYMREVGNHLRRARKLNSGGKYTTTDLANIRKMQRNRCARCGECILKNKYEIDHIMPLALGGTNDKRNIQILCAPCNRAKWAHDPIEDARSIGRLL